MEDPRVRVNARTSRRTGAILFFQDEASVWGDFHAGTTWGIVGETLRLPQAPTAQRRLCHMLMDGTPEDLINDVKTSFGGKVTVGEDLAKFRTN